MIRLRCRSEHDFPPFVGNCLPEASTGGGDSEYLGREAALLFLSVTLPPGGGLVSGGEWGSDVLLGTKGELMGTSEFRASL